MINKKIKYAILYLVIMGVVGHFYINGFTISGEKISQVIEQYFGVSKYIILVILISNFFTIFIENKKKRNSLVLIFHMLYPLFLAIENIMVSYKLNIFARNPLEISQYEFLQIALFKYKLGLISTYILSKTIMSGETKLFWGVIAGSLILILMMILIVFNLTVIKSIQKLKKERQLRREIEEEEKKILENIAIKEAIERKQLEQLEKIMDEKEKSIKKKVEDMNPYFFEYLSRESEEEDKNLIKKDLELPKEPSSEEEESLQILSLDVFEDFEKKLNEKKGEE